eukprot:Skav213662  [mRNA]  locus=scaffold2012:477418:478920:+ [translate_table: standard]
MTALSRSTSWLGASPSDASRYPRSLKSEVKKSNLSSLARGIIIALGRSTREKPTFNGGPSPFKNSTDKSRFEGKDLARRIR